MHTGEFEKQVYSSRYMQVHDPHTVMDEALQYHIQGDKNQYYCDALPEPERQQTTALSINKLSRGQFISTVKFVTLSYLNT